MANVTLGRTGIVVEQNGFGALPIQRVGFEEAGKLLNRALDGGMNLIDTARAYSDSEEKIGRAIAHRRQEYTLATKTGATTPEGFRRDLDTSLRLLKTDHIDIYQFHCAGQCYRCMRACSSPSAIWRASAISRWWSAASGRMWALLP